MTADLSAAAARVRSPWTAARAAPVFVHCPCSTGGGRWPQPYAVREAAGTGALGNAGDGVYVKLDAGAGNTILGNLISANGGYGISLWVAVSEDFNTIGLDRFFAAVPALRNFLGGLEFGFYGPNDVHQ